MEKTLADELYEHCESATSDLSDEAYVETLEDLISNLQSSVNAKREELDRK